MSRNSNIPSVKEISSHIKANRRKAQLRFFRKLMVVLMSSLFLFAISFGLFTLDQSTLLRVQNIIISDVRLSSLQAIQEQLPFSVGDRLWLHLPWFTKIEVNDDAIESISFVYNQNNAFITVKENKPLARTSEALLLSNGVFYPLKAEHSNLFYYLPQLEGFNESELSVKLASSLLGLEDFVLNLMANIKQNPSTYDEAMMIVTLDNGLNIHTDLRSLDLLNQLPLFIDLIDENNDCLYLDSVTSTARAAPCP